MVRKVPTIIASSARPLSTQLMLKTGENYTCPWQLHPTQDKNRFNLFKGPRKRFVVQFRDEAALSEAAQKHRHCKIASKDESLYGSSLPGSRTMRRLKKECSCKR